MTGLHPLTKGVQLSLTDIAFPFALAMVLRAAEYVRVGVVAMRDPVARRTFVDRLSFHGAFTIAKQCRGRIAEFLMPLAGAACFVMGDVCIDVTVPTSGGTTTTALSSGLWWVASMACLLVGIWPIGSATRGTSSIVLSHHGCVCPRCLYDLRSLVDERLSVDRCPECGLHMGVLALPSIWVGMLYVPRLPRRATPNRACHRMLL